MAKRPRSLYPSVEAGGLLPSERDAILLWEGNASKWFQCEYEKKIRTDPDAASKLDAAKAAYDEPGRRLYGRRIRSITRQRIAEMQEWMDQASADIEKYGMEPPPPLPQIKTKAALIRAV